MRQILPFVLIHVAFGSDIVYEGLSCTGSAEGGVRNVPSDLGPFTSVSLGQSLGCAVTTQRQVRCWGGVTDASNTSYGAATIPSDLPFVDAVHVAAKATCVSQDKVTERCWGDDASLQPTPGYPFDQYAMAYKHGCLLYNGNVTCMGKNDDRLIVPSSVQGSVVQVEGTIGATCVLNGDNSVACWGHSKGVNYVKQGLGPVRRLHPSSATAVHICVELTNGSHTCWGSPEAIAEDFIPDDLELNNGGVQQLYVGGWFMCAQRDNGQVQCWGSSQYATTVPTDWILAPGEYLVAGSGVACRYKAVTTTSTTTSTSGTSTSTTTSSSSATMTSSRTTTASETSTSSSTSMSLPPTTTSETFTFSSTSISLTLTTTPETSTSSSTSRSLTPKSSTLSTSGSHSSSSSRTLSTTVSMTSATLMSTSMGVSKTSTTLTPTSAGSTEGAATSSSVSMSDSNLLATSSMGLLATDTSSLSAASSDTSVPFQSATTSPPLLSSQTSTTTLSGFPSLGETAQALFSALEDAVSKLLATLRASNATTVTAALPDGSIVAASRLDRAAIAGVAAKEGLDSFSVAVPDMGIDISLPVTMFAKLGVDEDVAMVVASLQGLGEEFHQGKGGEGVEVAGAIVMELASLAGSGSLSVEGLIEPITFSFRANVTPSTSCAFWDESLGDWSTRGVWRSDANVAPGRIECKTLHLSLFGAILRSILETLACMNVLNMLNAEAMREILEGSWLASLGATMLAALFLVLAFCLAAAAYLDHMRWKQHKWKDSFLMVYKPAPLPDSASAPAPASSPGGDAYGIGGACVCCRWLQESDVARQAMDDIVSSWFEHFGEVRTAIETCISCVGNDLAAIGMGIFSGQLYRLTHKAAAKMMILVSRRNTAAHLGMNPEMLSFVLDDEDLAKYLVEQMSHSGGQNWRRIESQADAWAGLREEISNHVVENIKKQGSRSPLHYLKTVVMMSLTENPIGALFVYDIFCSCKQRVFIFSAELLGALAVSCLFFERTGMARGKPRRTAGCEQNEDDGLDVGGSIGRFIVVAMACLLVAALPVSILSSFQTKSFRVMSDPPGSKAWDKQLRVWRFQEVLVMILCVLYNTLCTFYIVTFVANIGNADQPEWSTTGALALFQDVLLMPGLTALVLPLIAQVILALHLRVGGVHQDRFARQVCEDFHNSSNAMLPVERL